MPDTAAVALVPGATGRAIRVAGDVLTMMEFHAALERSTGRRLWPRRRGDADELAAEIRRRQAKAPTRGSTSPSSTPEAWSQARPS
ncbi:hypothetical protein ACFYUV_10775 [Nonomuraea sp. NPDC003560]|uniref:hypothetical protein n=1 Tax=Nonomuraea sp. NPDC003560 TaxID=3364341 RepID=UPI0036A4BCC2